MDLAQPGLGFKLLASVQEGDRALQNFITSFSQTLDRRPDEDMGLEPLPLKLVSVPMPGVQTCEIGFQVAR